LSSNPPFNTFTFTMLSAQRKRINQQGQMLPLRASFVDHREMAISMRQLKAVEKLRARIAKLWCTGKHN
jgi:hypothetical protein